MTTLSRAHVMRVGIPWWGGRVSPVLDTAERLLVAEREDGEWVLGREVLLGRSSLPERAARIAGLGLDAIICGAISRPLAGLLESSGARVIPWISGTVEDVLNGFARGELGRKRYLMPGCCREQGRGRGRHRRRGGGSGRRAAE